MTYHTTHVSAVPTDMRKNCGERTTADCLGAFFGFDLRGTGGAETLFGGMPDGTDTVEDL